MADFDSDPEAAAGDALATYVREVASTVMANLERQHAERGDAAALGLTFGSIAGASTFLAKLMGAAYAIETLDLYASPLRNFLTEHGGPGVGTCQ